MEWEAQQQPQQLPQVSLPTAFGGTEGGDGVGGSLYVKVMTDEQLEILRTQIAVYSAICEQLVDMHKAVTAQQDLAGVRLGNPYCDPFISSIGGHKISARQRWTPTPIQLQKLERIFDQGMGTPSKQKIKEITSELSQHGQISETNVYNWFQNRRARSKRKQQNNNNNGASSNNAEQQQEVEADIESPKDKKKTKSDENFYNNLCPGTSGEAHPSYLHSHQEMMMRSGIDGSNPQQSNNKMEPVFVGDEGNVKPACQTQSVGQQLSFMESMLETQRFDHLIGKMEEVPSSYSLYHSGEDYNMTG